ncbi:pancreatic lipase-related protein 2-like isoform X2 [Photinus pyralis]|uniref:pancreatic lipase-related protein 2-like isoform X2 n=1 Tax=Photinus pyralis TaxID=7054 RepID=UPI0012676AFD|nr:pancreatic lipase-related protein 2-like isoform X2 [Photinus pyralis]
MRFKAELLLIFIKITLASDKVHNFVHLTWDYLKDGVTDMMDCIRIKHPPRVDDVKFYLFTPKTGDEGQEINNFTIRNIEGFNKTFYTKILIHGYAQNYKNEVLLKMKDGQITGYLMAKLIPEKTHVIGFSLGAHVAGIGAQMQSAKVLRITGLDPAGPMFINTAENQRLDKSSAKNVDIIHTSRAGVSSPVGHADFYVNGGKVQPNCSSTDVACSHRRSMELYLESITSNVGFKAFECDSVSNFENNKCINNTFAPMGEPWLSRGALRGIFYIKTNPTEPFASDKDEND